MAFFSYIYSVSIRPILGFGFLSFYNLGGNVMSKTVAVVLNDDDFKKLNRIKERYHYSNNSETLRSIINDEDTLLDLENVKAIPGGITNMTPERYIDFLESPMALFATGVNWEDKVKLKKILDIYTDIQDQQNAILRTIVTLQALLSENRNVTQELKELKECIGITQKKVNSLYKEGK